MGDRLSLSRISALAGVGGYEVVTHLSSASAVVALSICDMLLCSREWANGYEFTDEQLDQIDEYVSQLVYELMTPAMTQQLGSIVPHVLSTFPAWLLPCDGTEYLRVDYPDLYAVLDDAFIVDADHFVTPDLSDNFMRGESAGNIGDSGGVASVTLTESQMPAHNHGYSLPTTGTVVNGELVPDILVAHNPAVGGNVTGSAGGGQSHENLPPFVVVRYGIVCFVGVGLSTFPSVPTQVFSSHFWLDMLAVTFLRAMTYVGDTAQYNSQYYYTTIPANGVDILSFSLALGVGDYEVGLVGAQTTNSGIFRWFVSGDEIASDIDQYGAITRNYVHTKTFSVAVDGVYEFVLRCTGKNAASGNYYFEGTGFWVRKV